MFVLLAIVVVMLLLLLLVPKVSLFSELWIGRRKKEEEKESVLPN